MPVIQNDNGVHSVRGLPLRWGIRAYRELKAAQGDALGAMPKRYKQLSLLLDDVTSAPFAIDATDAQLCILAEQFAADCIAASAKIHDRAALRQRVELICRLRGIVPPDVRDDLQSILRCSDAAWWRRNMRRVHGRAFEAAAIRLGLVSRREGSYCSNEAAAQRIAQNRRNAASLASVTMKNEDTGQTFTLAELAARGNGNKRIRRGELMLRMAGCEEIAIERGDVGLFVTLTCPSKFHAVMAASGAVNPKYNGALPPEAQAYLNAVWARTRAANKRDGIAPYGFRIAEPHHDGCPHWHMLVFVGAGEAATFSANLGRYALAEDGDEAGAATQRLKIVSIDPALGSAAGYIAKYVGKNIDDEHVDGAHDEEGAVGVDLLGDSFIKPSQRVDAWASRWNIRQFQPLGQPPVTVWREMRRVAAAAVAGAPAHILAAHAACQRIEHTEAETGEIVVDHAANYAEYIRAQGGVNMGRDYLIGVAAVLTAVEGRYGMTERDVPTGIYCKTAPDAVYASTRYTWTRSGGGVALRSPWSPVNNCTPGFNPAWTDGAPAQQEIEKYDPAEWFDSTECGATLVSFDEIERELIDSWHHAQWLKENTVFTELSFKGTSKNA